MPIIVLILGMLLLLANVLYLLTCLMLIDEVNKGKKKNLKAIKFFWKNKADEEKYADQYIDELEKLFSRDRKKELQ
jgi:hypothetical protein